MLRASPPGALGSRGALGGVRLRAQPPRSAPARAPPPPAAPVAELERLRLHNLSPSPGSRRKNQRIGRGHSAGQARARPPPPRASPRSPPPPPPRGGVRAAWRQP